MPGFSSLDIFRKVPVDLTQTTRRGGIISMFVAAVIGMVLFCETWTYFAGETKSHVLLDSNTESKLAINFELSFYELPCRFATIELWDYLGNNKLDVSARVRKTVIGGQEGEELKHDYEHRALPQTEKIAHDDNSKSLPNEVVQLQSNNYGSYLKENEYTFVLYYVDVREFTIFLFSFPLLRCVFCCPYSQSFVNEANRSFFPRSRDYYNSGACFAKWFARFGISLPSTYRLSARTSK